MDTDLVAKDKTSIHVHIEGLPNLLEICLDRLNDAILITDAKLINGFGHTITWANRAFYSQNGYEANEIIGQTPRILQGINTDRSILDKVRYALENHQKIRVELLNYRKNGSTYWNEIVIVPITNQHEVVTHYVSIQRDVSLRKQLETAVQDEKEYAENIVESVREPLIVLSSALKILTANTSFYDTFKTTPQETIGQFIYDLGNQQWDIPELRVLFEKILPMSSVFNGYEVQHNFPGIGMKTMVLNAREIFRKSIGSNIILLAMEDITERKLKEDLEHQLAYFDSLTKLANRLLLKDRLMQSMLSGKRNHSYGVLMFLDLDHFKPVNDLYGHDAGDTLLIEVAERLKTCVRLVDTVSRFGGDEFVVLLSDLPGNIRQARIEARHVAEKIRITLSVPYLLRLALDDADLERVVTHSCTASIGAVLFLGQDSTYDAIMRNADAAMYQAKACGGNSVRFFED